MIELFETNLRDSGRRSSKGNQLKWENDGIWYKADYLGYEGLSEYVVSHLLCKSSLAAEEYVIYDPEEIKYGRQIFRGCKCKDYSDGWSTITLERLFKNNYGTSLNHSIYSIRDHEERLSYLVDQVQRVTGIKDFGIYISKLFAIDALFLNEDRHTHNIAVLMNDKGEYRLCPIYDNGAALLSDTMMDYPLDGDLCEEIGVVKPKTICDSFDEQLEIAEKLYGQQISFNFSRSYLTDVMDKATIYDIDTRNRVRDIIFEQMRKYPGYFE